MAKVSREHDIPLSDAHNGKDGINGVDGKDGKDGINGVDGKDGKLRPGRQSVM